MERAEFFGVPQGRTDRHCNEDPEYGEENNRQGCAEVSDSSEDERCQTQIDQEPVRVLRDLHFARNHSTPAARPKLGMYRRLPKGPRFASESLDADTGRASFRNDALTVALGFIGKVVYS